MTVNHIYFIAPKKVGAFRQGKTTRNNNHSIARHFNNAME